MPNPTIVSAALNDKELRDSITKLVEDYKNSLNDMKTATTKTVGEIQEIIKSIGSTKVDFSGTLDGLEKAKKKMATAASGGGGTTAPTKDKYADNTIGALEESIRLEEKKRKQMELNSNELKNQNLIIEEQNKKLREQKSLNTWDNYRKNAKNEFGAINALSSSTIPKAEKKLQELIALQDKYRGTKAFDEKQWNRLEMAIDNVKNKIERLKSKKPMTMQEVLSLDESSVDAIARKMQALKKVNIDPKNVAQVRELGNEYQRLSRLQSELLGKGVQLTKSNNYLAQSFGYIRNRIVYAMTLGAATSFVKQIYEIRGQYELLERSLGVLVNSFEKGSHIFNELNQMSIKSPFTLMELAGAAKQLTAYNFSANEVVDTTRRLADLSAALGVPMERLTYNLGQIRAQTVLTARDARDFANAGLPIVKSLSDYYTELEGRLVSTGEVYDRMSKKMVSYNDVLSVLNKMTDEGGKFFDFQAKQAETLRVQMNNLTLAWNNMLNEIGEMNQGLLELPLGVLKSLFQNWKSINQALNDVLITIGLVKGVEIAMNLVMGTSVSAINAQVLATKKKVASDLQRKALTESLTIEEQKLLVTSKQITAEDYRQILSTKNLTKQQALLMAAFQGRNKSLMTALIRMGLLTAAEIRSMSVGKALTLVWRSMAMSLKSLGAALISAWPVALLMGVVDIIQHVNSVSEKNIELNKSVADSAKEASESLEKFLSLEANVEARSKAKQGALSDESAGKTWKAVREQIETASQASDVFINKLLDEEDLNKRVSKAFDVAEKIKEATYAVSGFIDELKIDQDSWLGGLFGEGLAEDIQDYTDHLNKLDENAEFAAKKNRGFWESVEFMASNVAHGISEVFGESSSEAEQEIRDFATNAAQEIKERLGNEGSKDAEKVTEAIARVVRAVEDANPKIQGKGKVLFESVLDSVMSNEFGNDVYDKATTLYNRVLEQMKHDSSSAFSEINQDVLSNIYQWSPAQEKAFRDAASKIKETLPPAFRSTLDMMMKDLNSRDWRVRVYTVFGNPNEEKKSFYDQLKDADTAADAAYTKIQRLTTRINELKSAGKDTTDVTKELTQAQKDLSDAESKGGHSSKQRKANTKAQKEAESELTKALKEELSTIEKVRSIYKELTKDGASHVDAIKSATEGWEETVNAINKVLNKNGLKGLNLSDFVGVENPREILKTLQAQLDEMVKRGAKPAEIQVLQEKIKTIKVDAEKYDLTKITKGLNNELDRLKEEYELAVALDADPELGSMFADWMGIDMRDLPRTASEYAKRYTDTINKKLKEYNANIKLPNLLNITDDDLRELQNRVGTGGITQKYVDDITNGVKAVREVFKKEKEDTSRDWNALIEKYGGLQAKLLKIYKDNVQQQASIVREFGTNDEQIKALDLVSKIKISQDPAEIARLQEELAKVMNDVTSKNPVALKTYQAVRNEQESQTGKAYWEDFKDSDLYSMTFTDMANNSTQAIQMIINKLNELKDKVKEDPASMKALIKSLEDAEGELMSRDPFAGISNSISTWIKATKEQKDAQKELEQANIEVAGSEIALKNAQSVGDKVAIAKAEQQLVQEQQKQATAQAKVVQSGNKAKKAQEQLKNSLQNLSNELGNVSGLLGSVSQIFRAVGDDDTADAIDAINQGFTIMTTVISAVTAALVILQSSNPWLLAMAAALSVIVGLVSFLSGNSNKKITEQVEASERAVKRLELAYVDLQQAVDKAYGTATIGAKQATLANKELQLAEIQRQIQLEKSRTGKNRDEDKIIDLQKQYKELFYEIKNGYTEIVDDLMGTDVASFAENLVSSMIDAFKQGEDYMKVFSDKFDEMIDNMIMKSIVSRVVSQYLNQIWDSIDQRINDRSQEERNEYGEAQSYAEKVRGMSDEELKKEIAMQRTDKWSDFIHTWATLTDKDIEEYRKAVAAEEIAAKKRLDAASEFTGSDVDYIMGQITEVMPELGEKLKNILGEYYKFGESSDTQLSALQQGIQGVTETTAGALEGYMNGVSQQVYYQSDLMTQIRDAVVGFNMDVQVASMSQILLQLRSSYEMQTAIHSMLEGWSSPNGMSVRVEMI